MNDISKIVKLAVDYCHGKVKDYTINEASDVLNQALVEANGGSTSFDYRRIRDGQCSGFFSIMEKIIGSTMIEQIENDNTFNAFVEVININDGDQARIAVEDSTLYTVSATADGTQNVRRQRIDGYNTVVIPTQTYTVKAYDEMSRFLSNKVDIAKVTTKVAASFAQKFIEMSYSALLNASSTTLGGSAFFPTAGTYDADELLKVIEHVEANGKRAMLVCTKAAARLAKEDIQSDGAKEELHNLGYYGTFYGTPVMVVPQRHKVGTTDFMFDNKTIFVFAIDAKPIKLVYEGSPLIIPRAGENNGDLTVELFYAVKAGVAVVVGGDGGNVGKYQIS